MDPGLMELVREGDPEAQCMLAVAYLNGESRDRRRALYWLRRSAGAGFAPAQYALANLHLRASHGALSRPALRWFTRAAAQGDIDAQLALAYRYTAQGAQRDAIRWFRRAAHAGEATAQYHLARAFESGNGTARDYTKAATWYRRAARGGDLRAQVALGRMCAEGLGGARDLPRAVRWYRRAAESGSRHAQCIVGLHYLSGHGARRDVPEALGWLRRAASQDYPLAQYTLGVVLMAAPEGVDQEPIEGLRWLEAAAAAGQLDAVVALARAHLDNALIPRDLRRARGLLRAACSKGHAAAWRELAETYAGAYGSRPTWPRAAGLYRVAARHGDAWAQFRLGTCYLHGLGLARDPRLARRWLERAATGGVLAASRILEGRLAA
jgi:hypothetical protein